MNDKDAAAQVNDALDKTKNELKLDYTLQDPGARNELVKKIIEQTPPQRLTPKYLQLLADYLVFAMDKEERKKKNIITDNRMVTVNKRETSFEGLVEKFQNGEDGIYNIITNDKNIIFTPKISITEEDIQTIPGMKQLRDAIAQIEAQEKVATGKRRFLLKKQLIEMRKDQYVLKSTFKAPIYCLNATKSFNHIALEEKISVNEDGSLKIEGNFSLLNPDHVSAVLCNYSRIKQDCWGQFSSDAYYMIQDLENLVDETLEKDFPLYYDLLIYKIDGKTNEEIQSLLERDYGVRHSVEYISSLWRNKIPKMIAEQARKDWLIWHYTFEEKGQWKKCSRCGQIKLAHNMFFSKNNTSKDGFYSICKDCRNAKTKECLLENKRKENNICKDKFQMIWINATVKSRTNG